MSLPEQPQEKPLENRGVLEKVFGYVGSRQSCFVRVNRQWNDIYVQLFGAKTTYDAAVVSVARDEVAVAEGCPLSGRLLILADLSGNFEVCMKLGSMNFPWSSGICASAAEAGGAWSGKGFSNPRTMVNMDASVASINLQLERESKTCERAACVSDLEILEWLLLILNWKVERKGPDPCPWYSRTSPREVMWMYFNGFGKVQMYALGMRAPVKQLFGKASWRHCKMVFINLQLER
ncbi:unnamed protein product [Chrysoparadoxa australica]